jgi:hypothetical protein
MYASLLFAAGMIASVLGHPSNKRDFQTVHLTFSGGPASYTMTIPADGNTYPTSKQ